MVHIANVGREDGGTALRVRVVRGRCIGRHAHLLVHGQVVRAVEVRLEVADILANGELQRWQRQVARPGLWPAEVVEAARTRRFPRLRSTTRAVRETEDDLNRRSRRGLLLRRLGACIAAFARGELVPAAAGARRRVRLHFDFVELGLG